MIHFMATSKEVNYPVVLKEALVFHAVLAANKFS